jgi:hypothetical protein
VAETSGHYRLQAKGPFPHVRLAYLGLDRAIDNVNGARIKDATGLMKVGQRLLTRPPADVRFWESGNTRVVYARRRIFDRLATAMSTLPFPTVPQGPICPAPEGPAQVTLCVDYHVLRCEPTRDSPCATFVSEVEKAARTVGAPRVDEHVDCSDLRHVPTLAAVHFRDRVIELRYVDWMPEISVDDAGDGLHLGGSAR